eukprot:g53355.t1
MAEESKPKTIVGFNSAASYVLPIHNVVALSSNAPMEYPNMDLWERSMFQWSAFRAPPRHGSGITIKASKPP